MVNLIEVEPQPRIDSLVRLADGGEARRTDYTGTVWLDGKPQISGLTLHRAPNAPKGIRVPNFQRAFFVPDCLPYARGALGNATLTTSAALRASGETAAIVTAAATFTDDPSGAPTWIQVHICGHIGWPAAVDYRIVAVTPPDAVR